MIDVARCNLTSERIPVDAIVVGKRHRAINPDRVKALAESIKTLGLRTPITVYDGETTDEDGCVTNAAFLVAGAHRLEALKAIGEAEADVIFVEPDPIDVKLWEIAENLHRAELTALERSEHIAEWVRLIEGKGGQSAHPDARYQKRGVSEASRELGVERTDVRRAVKVDSLTDEAKAVARELGLDDNRSALLEAAKVAPEQQADTLRRRTIVRDEPAITKADGPDMYVEARKLAGKFSVAELQTLLDHLTDILKERLG